MHGTVYIHAGDRSNRTRLGKRSVLHLIMKATYKIKYIAIDYKTQGRNFISRHYIQMDTPKKFYI